MPNLTGLSAALSGQYELVRELGRGGAATVFLARDLKHAREVAIKILRPELAELIGRKRFLAEIRIAANLQHPHILPVFDSGESDGSLYLVAPYVRGGSLRDRVAREGRIGPDEAVELAREIADALTSSHEAGVVHRDVKPGNILLSKGHALLGDFGVALRRERSGASRLTEMGVALGTPAYMSPEQVEGAANLDGRSDIYSLGCVLYEMLTGAPPFQGSSAGLISRLIRPAPTVAEAGVEVPETVERALEIALAQDPGQRFGTAKEFRRALRISASRYGTTGAPATAATQARPPPNLGALVKRMCDRWRQVNAFESFLRKTWQEQPGKPQLYVIHGEEGAGHSSLLERLLHTRIAKFADGISDSGTQSIVRVTVPWPVGTDEGVLRRDLAIGLFRELDASYMDEDLSAARMVRLPGLALSDVVVVEHDVRARHWTAAAPRLLGWYAADFLGSVPSGRRQPQVLVFIKVVFDRAGSATWLASRLHERLKNRVSAALESALSKGDHDCPWTVLEELAPVTVEDVKDWFIKNRIYDSEEKQIRIAEGLFARAISETLPMATVEAALADIHRTFLAEHSA